MRTVVAVRDGNSFVAGSRTNLNEQRDAAVNRRPEARATGGGLFLRSLAVRHRVISRKQERDIFAGRAVELDHNLGVLKLNAALQGFGCALKTFRVFGIGNPRVV